MKTGPSARTDARVAIRDKSGILSNVFASSGGTDTLRFVTQGDVAGNFKVRISSLYNLATYNVGDVGPAGGTIFYKNGNFYLETTPASQDQTAKQFSSDTLSFYQLVTKENIGDGLYNTNLMANYSTSFFLATYYRHSYS